MVLFMNNMDMFAGDYDAIVNTVNCVGVMGKGIALEFKKRYPKNFTLYKDACKSDRLTPGNLLTTHITGYPFIINFSTKNHWRNNSKLEWIDHGLQELVKFLQVHPEIESIGIPPLGCGNGKLDWNDVRELVLKYLSEISTRCYVFPPL